MPDMSVLRENMVRYQIAARGVSDDRVLDAMRDVPREAFMPEALAEFAYEDTPLPIEEGQAISRGAAGSPRSMRPTRWRL